ncbi:MAG: hypothetical protein MI743_14595 [Sneathiellales bacterium]|nr:hypothetical protein [Sneathiellales bacterium]
MTSMLDLADLDLAPVAEKGAVLTLRNPVSGTELQTLIWLQGMDAPAYQKKLRDQIDAQISEGKADLSAAELEERLVDRLAVVTMRWEQVFYKGETLPCDFQNARKLYREQHWIREQVQQFVEDRSRFLSE